MRKHRTWVALAVAVACTETRAPEGALAPEALLNVSAGEPRRFVVVFNQPHGLPRDVERIVAGAGGTISDALPQIGAISVRSSNPAFAKQLAKVPGVKVVAEDPDVQLIPDTQELSTFAAADATNTPGPAEPPGPDDPAGGTEPLYHQQWDKMRMNASLSGSYAVQLGRREVVVAILDTGIEITHPDLLPNLDIARSRSFVPTEPSIDDENGHGSWCASAVASPINQFGISGVAPNVTIVALKVADRQRRGNLFWLAAALVYAGEQRFDIASMSISGLASHASSQQMLTVLQRAINFARASGVTPIAGLGNNLRDLSDGDFFESSILWPAEMPGVIGVSATGYLNHRSWYSNYGMGKTDVSAPGGAVLGQHPPPTYRGGGAVLGAWAPETIESISPDRREEQCTPDGICHYYRWIEGTAMAAHNAAGVAALIISQYGDFTPDGSRKFHMSPQAVESILQRTANNQPCPEPNSQNFTVSPGPPFGRPVTITTTCRGEAGGYTSYFGKGIVDAFKAVTEGPGSGAADVATRR